MKRNSKSGVYKKKGKHGKMMYFQDGKFISKETYDALKNPRKNGTKKGQVRKTARRAYMKKNTSRRSYMQQVYGEKFPITINKTQQNALLEYYSGNPDINTMYLLATRAKKKTKSARVMTFMASEKFIDALKRELRDAIMYSNIKTDRDFNALKSLEEQIKRF